MRFETQTLYLIFKSHISYLKASIRPLTNQSKQKYYADTVNVLPVTVTVYFCKGNAAGPCTTAPVLLNSLPCAGQINMP